MNLQIQNDYSFFKTFPGLLQYEHSYLESRDEMCAKIVLKEA